MPDQDNADFLNALAPEPDPSVPESTPAPEAPAQLQAQTADAGAAGVATQPVEAKQVEAKPEPAPEPEAPKADLVKMPELRQEQINPIQHITERQEYRDHLDAIRNPLKHLPEVKPPQVEPEKSFTDQFIKPIGQFAKGFIGGNIDVADTINALAQTPGKLGPQAGSQPIEDYGQKYERNFGKEDVGSGPYEAGKIAGQLGTYGATSAGLGALATAAGVPAAGAGALGLAGAGVEGALQGAGQAAREQLRKTGRVEDTGGFAGSTALGAGLGLAGGFAGNVLSGVVSRTAKNYGVEAAKSTAQKLSKEAQKIIDAAEGGTEAAVQAASDIEKVIKAVADEALAHEIEGVNFVADTFNKLPKPENAFQQAQRAALAKEEATPFRLRKRNKGFANIEHALGLDEIAKHLPPDLHARYTEAVHAMGEAKAVMMHLENEVEAFAQNAMKHASDKDQLSKIVVQKSTRLRSDAAVEVAEKRAELYLKERMQRISRLDAAIQKSVLDHVEDIPMEKYLYGIASRHDDQFQMPHSLANNFDDAYNQFVKSSDLVKAAEKQYRKLAKHFTPVFEEAEKAFQESTGDKVSRLFGKIKITNPFSQEAPRAFRKYAYLSDDELDAEIARLSNYRAPSIPEETQPWRRGGRDGGIAAAARKLKRLSREVEARMSERANPYAGLSDEELAAAMEGATPLQEHKIGIEILKRAGMADAEELAARTTDFAIGLQFKPFTARMSKTIADEIEALTASLMKEEENVATEITYKVGGIEALTKQSGADAINKLRELGVLHPVAEKLALAAAFGLRALDTPAEAFDGSPKEQKHFFAQLGTVAVATILGAKYGVPAAQRIIKMKGWYYARFLANTRELAAFADSAMGIDSKLNPDASLSHNIGALAGKVINAVVQAPDDHIYLLKALHSEVDPKLLSPLGKKLVDEIRDEAKAFRQFVDGYARAWNKTYKAFPQAKQDQLDYVHHAVKFVEENFGKGPRVRNQFDKAMTNLFGNTAQAWFTYNPKIWIGSVADLAITGPLQVGPGAMANAAKMRFTNPVVNGLLERIHLGGVRSQGIQNVAQKSTTLSSEAIQNRTMIAASLIHFFETHPRAMRAENIRTPEEFVRKALTGQLSHDLNADTFVQLAADLAESIGTDPLQLTKGAFGRSMFGKFVQFTSQPERYARLVALRMTTNPKWVVASMAMLHQVAGQSLLPMSAKIAGIAVLPDATTKLLGFLNMTSAGQHLLGPMNTMLDWDPFLYPAMGVEAPGFSSMLELLGDWPSTSAAMGEVMYQASQGGTGFNRMTGNPQNETNDKAQKALHKLLMQLAIVRPMLGLVPTRLVSSFLYHGPAAMHGVARVNVPAPLHIGDTKPTKPSEVVRFDGATEQSVRAMFGLPDTFKVGTYKLTNAVPKSKGTRLQSNE